MSNRKLILVLLFIFNTILVFGQCEYTLDNFSHNDCYGANGGTIEVTISNLNASISWIGPNGFNSTNTNLNNLYAGTYYLTITNSIQACSIIDSIDIEETIDISADFNLKGRCEDEDSVNVVTFLWGGTPPYSTIWSNGDTSRNITNLPSTGSAPHILTVTDANFCTDTIHLFIREVNEMNPFMSTVAAICKDDSNGEARVFVQQGTPPFVFNWRDQGELFSQENDVLVIDSFSSISGLIPGIYLVEIIDDMGCIIEDSVEVKSNPNTCLTIYKAFTPNNDGANEFWEIKNINLYPEAIVSVYNKEGTQVFRRRNYVNAEAYAFSGKSQDSQYLSSGTYFYIIDLANGDEVFKGTVTIVR